jgi:hypothetical protein
VLSQIMERARYSFDLDAAVLVTSRSRQLQSLDPPRHTMQDDVGSKAQAKRAQPLSQARRWCGVAAPRVVSSGLSWQPHQPFTSTRPATQSLVINQWTETMPGSAS